MQDPKLTLADQEIPTKMAPTRKGQSMATIAAMLAAAFNPVNHRPENYQPKNLLAVDGDQKLSAADAKRLRRQQRNIKNASV